MSPYRRLAGWLAVVATLGIIGLDVESRLAPTSLEIPGSESSRGDELLQRHFGPSEPLVVMLRGPRPELRSQGALLVREVNRLGARTLSPWTTGAEVDRLRVGPNAVLILADFPVEDSRDTAGLADRVRRTVDDTTEAPVQAHLTGFAVIGEALEDASLRETERAELIAAPILLIVLLLVFRSPIAAAIPLLFGIATVLASRGLIALVATQVDLDALAISAASMMGLALGVDYALLLVSRFREEIEEHSVADAAAVSTARAGRTIFFAGAVLACAMLVGVVAAPGPLLLSLPLAVLLVVIVSVFNALVAGPALLLAVGTNLDRWMLGSPRRHGLPILFRQALRRPLLTAALVLIVMLSLGAPVLAMNTGAPNVRQLPADDRARRDYETIERVAGAGWSGPFVIALAKQQGGPVTEPSTLRSLGRWQRHIAARTDVVAAFGPGQLADRGSSLLEAPANIDQTSAQLKEGREGLVRLSHGLQRATGGVGQLRNGLDAAVTGSARVEEGAIRGTIGAQRLQTAVQEAGREATPAIAMLRRLGASTRRLGAAGRQIGGGAERLAEGLTRLERAVQILVLPGAEQLSSSLSRGAGDLETLRSAAQTTQSELETAFEELNQVTIGAGDPHYGPALEAVGRALAAVSGRNPVSGAQVHPGYEGMDTELAGASQGASQAAAGARTLSTGVTNLLGGIKRLRAGALELADGSRGFGAGGNRLATGARRLSGGASEIAGGLDRLRDGAGRLSGGLGRLRQGSGTLTAELVNGYRHTQPLERGLAGGSERIGPYRRQLASQDQQLRELRQRSPHLFDSGYFFLAGLDGASDFDRRRAELAVSLHTGGQAARMVVIPRAAPNSEGAAKTQGELESEVDGIARETRSRADLTGPAAQLSDYDRVTTARLPLVIAAVTVITYLLLVVVLRALVLPLIAVLLNLLTVAAGFGVLTLLFQTLPGHPLGGPGYTDAVSAAGIFGLVFGLSIDYEVFLLSRMREGYLLTGDNDASISYGLDRTAQVITGAAAIMIGVFLTFATSEITPIRQFGIGLSVAVALDATLVRLLILPALMRLCGRWTWWLPGWIESPLARLDRPSGPGDVGPGSEGWGQARSV